MCQFITPKNQEEATEKPPWYVDEIAVTNLLECTNYSMNFYVYCLTNGEIRKAVLTTLQQILVKLRCKSNRVFALQY